MLLRWMRLRPGEAPGTDELAGLQRRWMEPPLDDLLNELKDLHWVHMTRRWLGLGAPVFPMRRCWICSPVGRSTCRVVTIPTGPAIRVWPTSWIAANAGTAAALGCRWRSSGCSVRTPFRCAQVRGGG